LLAILIAMVRILLILGLLLPVFSYADVGFAKSSLWLSRTEITEGDSATLYASLSNAAQEELKGAVIFSDDGEEFGRTAISLAPGEGRIVQVSWKPAESGTHSLTAVLSNGTDDLDKLTIAVVVAEKPGSDAEAKAAAAIESSEDIQKTIADLSPQVGEAVNPIFNKMDDVRESGALFLDTQIENAKENLEAAKTRREELAKTAVLGAETSDEVKSEKRKLTVSYFFNTLLLYTLSAIRFVVGNAGIFYPVFAVLILVGLWKLFMRMRNPVRYASDI
jgi:hypothetical protein